MERSRSDSNCNCSFFKYLMSLSSSWSRISHCGALQTVRTRVRIAEATLLFRGPTISISMPSYVLATLDLLPFVSLRRLHTTVFALTDPTSLLGSSV